MNSCIFLFFGIILITWGVIKFSQYLELREKAQILLHQVEKLNDLSPPNEAIELKDLRIIGIPIIEDKCCWRMNYVFTITLEGNDTCIILLAGENHSEAKRIWMIAKSIKYTNEQILKKKG